MEHEHTAGAIHERLQAGPSHSYIRDFVYGGIDGAVTTFAVVSGVVGAQLSTVVILILSRKVTMNSLMENAARAEIAARLALLTPQSKRTWGVLMYRHLNLHLTQFDV